MKAENNQYSYFKITSVIVLSDGQLDRRCKSSLIVMCTAVRDKLVRLQTLDVGRREKAQPLRHRSAN